MTGAPAAPSRALRAQILTAEARPRAGQPDEPQPLRYLEDGLLVLGADGRIVEVAPWAPREGLRVSDLRPAVLLPGFVDAHVHFPQARIVGSASGPLLEWLERSVFPEEARFADVAYARAVAPEFVKSMLSSGTTTAAVFASSHAAATGVLFEELARSGMRAFAGLTPDRPRAHLKLAHPVSSPIGKHQVRRGVIDGDGAVEVGAPSSHLLHAYANATVLVHLPVGVDELPAGAPVDVWRIHD